MRILIVDDEYVNRAQLKALLASYGDCDAAPSAEMAFAMVKQALEEKVPYELITVDLNMPDHNGHWLLKEIRKWEFDSKVLQQGFLEAKIVMVTVQDTSKDIVGSFREGCEGYVVKPVTVGKLKEALDKLGIAPVS